MTNLFEEDHSFFITPRMRLRLECLAAVIKVASMQRIPPKGVEIQADAEKVEAWVLAAGEGDYV